MSCLAKFFFWGILVNLQNYEYCINSQVNKQFSGIEIKYNFCPSLNPRSVLYPLTVFEGNIYVKFHYDLNDVKKITLFEMFSL